MSSQPSANPTQEGFICRLLRICEELPSVPATAIAIFAIRIQEETFSVFCFSLTRWRYSPTNGVFPFISQSLFMTFLLSFFHSPGSTDSTESFKRGSCKYGSFRKRPTKDDMVIYSFEFEECVLAAYNTEPVECTVHGQLDLKELAPDAVSF